MIIVSKGARACVAFRRANAYMTQPNSLQTHEHEKVRRHALLKLGKPHPTRLLRKCCNFSLSSVLRCGAKATFPNFHVHLIFIQTLLGMRGIVRKNVSEIKAGLMALCSCCPSRLFN